MPGSTGLGFCGFILLSQEENEHRGIEAAEIGLSYLGGIAQGSSRLTVGSRTWRLGKSNVSR
jgi:hypothetical protein